VVVFDTENNSSEIISGFKATTNYVLVTPDGKKVYVGEYGFLEVIDTNTHKIAKQVRYQQIMLYGC
jgi:DNA-binding beta-propeller fold protein YncE